MPLYIGSTEIKKIFVGGKQIKKAYKGSELLYSSGNIVTYYVDSSVSYQEEVEDGQTCLEPKTFTPALTGWNFVGWRSDKTASGEVLQTLNMGDDPISLYAVFEQSVTLSYNNNGGTGNMNSETKPRYYNNGVVANAEFVVKQNTFQRTSYNFSNWRLDNASSGTVYRPNDPISLSKNGTLYAVWTYVGNPFYYIQEQDGLIYAGPYGTAFTVTESRNATDQVGTVYRTNSGQRIFVGSNMSDPDEMAWMEVTSDSIQTRGNNSLRIVLYTGPFAASIRITIPEISKTLECLTGERKTETFDISNVSSVTIKSINTVYGKTGNSVGSVPREVYFY